MYGTQTGTLNLYVMSAGNKGNPVWTKQGKNTLKSFTPSMPVLGYVFSSTLCA